MKNLLTISYDHATEEVVVSFSDDHKEVLMDVLKQMCPPVEEPKPPPELPRKMYIPSTMIPSGGIVIW